MTAKVFNIPGARVKNGDERLVVLNKAARPVVASRRGRHKTHVFDLEGKPILRILNSDWKRARIEIGLPHLRVHDLKHTFGRRLRAAEVTRLIEAAE